MTMRIIQSMIYGLIIFPALHFTALTERGEETSLSSPSCVVLTTLEVRLLSDHVWKDRIAWSLALYGGQRRSSASEQIEVVSDTGKWGP